MSRCRECCFRASSSDEGQRGAPARGDSGIGITGQSGVGAAGVEGEGREESLEYRVEVSSFEVAPRGRHVVFSLLVSRGDARWPIRRRFRQVVMLHGQLVRGLGRSAMRDGLPQLPPKVTCRSLCCGRHDDRFLAARAARLQRYFEELLRYIPYVDQCEALHEFLCSVDINAMSYDALLSLEEAMGRAPSSTPAIDPTAIAALPRRGVEAPFSSLASSQPRCVICQELFASDDDVRVLPCGHDYHFDCIKQWIPRSNSCCVCQAMAVLPSPLRGPPAK